MLFDVNYKLFLQKECIFAKIVVGVSNWIGFVHFY